MSANYTEIVVVLDMSGSMQAMRSDAIGGFNSFLKTQKELPGKANLSLITFNTICTVVHESKDLQEIPDLTEETYIPAGGTALNDAIGHAVDQLGERLRNLPEYKRPAKVIVAILTDGEENSSRKYTKGSIAERISHQQNKYSWDFIFLAANQDAFATGASYNILRANTFNFDVTSQGFRDAYNNLSSSTATYRTK